MFVRFESTTTIDPWNSQVPEDGSTLVITPQPVKLQEARNPLLNWKSSLKAKLVWWNSSAGSKQAPPALMGPQFTCPWPGRGPQTQSNAFWRSTSETLDLAMHQTVVYVVRMRSRGLKLRYTCSFMRTLEGCKAVAELSPSATPSSRSSDPQIATRATRWFTKTIFIVAFAPLSQKLAPWKPDSN